MYIILLIKNYTGHFKGLIIIIMKLEWNVEISWPLGALIKYAFVLEYS